MKMKHLGAGFLALVAATLFVLAATTGSVMRAETLGAERNNVGKLVDGQEPTLDGQSRTIAQALPPSKKQKVSELNEKNDKQTIAVAVGDKVEIKLSSNISTGYSWRVESVSGAAVKQDGAITYASTPLPPNSPPIVGRGGHSVVKFDAVAPGKVTIKLEYTRPWEKNKPPAQTFTITLDVK